MCAQTEAITLLSAYAKFFLFLFFHYLLIYFLFSFSHCLQCMQVNVVLSLGAYVCVNSYNGCRKNWVEISARRHSYLHTLLSYCTFYVALVYCSFWFLLWMVLIPFLFASDALFRWSNHNIVEMQCTIYDITRNTFLLPF